MATRAWTLQQFQELEETDVSHLLEWKLESEFLNCLRLSEYAPKCVDQRLWTTGNEKSPRLEIWWIWIWILTHWPSYSSYSWASIFSSIIGIIMFVWYNSGKILLATVCKASNTGIGRQTVGAQKMGVTPFKWEQVGNVIGRTWIRFQVGLKCEDLILWH